MRASMAAADIGDDVYGEDPSVNALQAFVAEKLAMESALFLPSGTQSNLCALLTHCQRGDEYIAGQTAHTYRYEAGGAAVLGGIQPQPLNFQGDGTLNLEEVRLAIKPDDPHFARTRLLCLENTHNGQPQSVEYYQAARATCDEHSLSLHLDGARLFNAAVALAVDVREFTSQCHSVSICLSKGLGAPAGSLLLGSSNFIAQARRWRKMLGGGMRQSGIYAAAGLYALQHHIDRLQEDHLRAESLASALSELPMFAGRIQQHTNMVFVDLSESELQAAMAIFQQSGIRISGSRWVTHLDIDDNDVQRIVNVARHIC